VPSKRREKVRDRTISTLPPGLDSPEAFPENEALDFALD
jgi:hypothetical protein